MTSVDPRMPLSGSSRILYLVSTQGNPSQALYSERLHLHGRMPTYGQHSFIYDLIHTLVRLGWNVDLVVDGVAQFPLSRPLNAVCRVMDVSAFPPVGSPEYEAALIDEVPDAMVDLIPDNVTAFRIVHHAGSTHTPTMVDRCSRFVCMTENALKRQASLLGADRVALIHQGVDTRRFTPRSWPEGVRTEVAIRGLQPKVLLYSRLEAGREDALFTAAHALLPISRVTVLGDGPAFWRFSDELGASLVLINFIPTHGIHNFVAEFDLVVSTGRGAMEGLACGIPVILAGQGYGGVVTRESMVDLLPFNLTGLGADRHIGSLISDVHSALAMPSRDCRQLAEEFCSMETFVQGLVGMFETRVRVDRP
jgi:glycosyltransferase involved in cell wall biosynthesis